MKVAVALPAIVALLLFAGCRGDRSTQAPVSTASDPAPAAAGRDAAPGVPGTTPQAAEAPQRDVPRLSPVDEGASDPEFRAYRERLLAAVRARDERALIALVAPDIFLSFGGGEQGAGAFRTTRKLWSRESEIWRELEEILTKGGVFRVITEERRQFCAPYVFASFPEEYDGFMNVAVTEPAAPLHAEPRDDSKVLATLAYEIVKPALFQPPELNHEDEHKTPDWRKVETFDGITGYIRESAIRSPLGYRACFEPRDGAWAMTVYVAGD
jgi:hypothetical protein